MLNQTMQNQLQHYAQRLKAAGINVESLIAFGSRVRGNHHDASDLDLCVVSKQFGQNRHTDRVTLMQIRDQQSINIEPHPYHPDDLEEKWDNLAQEIRDHGIKVE